MVPSKIFEYFATGKPIIHFFSDDNDSCLNYFDRYPLALTIKQDYGQLEENAKKVVNFIVSNKNKKIQLEEIEHRFPMNMPKYTAEKIDEMILKSF
jgi:CDP-glycerol glycerophosphotransferase (TagB/SpsB family)